MKIVSVNLANVGSTGGIVRQIAELAEENGITYYQAYPWSSKNKPAAEHDILIGTKWGKGLSIMLGRITGFQGCFSVFATKKFLKRLDEIKPDIMQLHNIHNSYINLPMLFKYIKKHDIKVVWTLHDTWSFTGQCSYFTMAKCEKWKDGCHDCPQYRGYPEAYVDQTKRMWKLKKRWFTGVKKLVVVTPSVWLKELAEQSYLKEYPVMVINNGINLKAFNPSAGDYKKQNNLEGKHIVLGVALDWEARKGLDVFVELSKRFDDSYQIILVGTNDEVDKDIPENIISIHRTHNQQELAVLYSAADVYVNPTREENFPTVNMEALACGTPVITFRTGGSPESLNDTCGIVVDCDDVDALEVAVKKVCETECFTEEDCVARGRQFDAKTRFKEYIEIYKNL